MKNLKYLVLIVLFSCKKKIDHTPLNTSGIENCTGVYAGLYSQSSTYYLNYDTGYTKSITVIKNPNPAISEIDFSSNIPSCYYLPDGKLTVKSYTNYESYSCSVKQDSLFYEYIQYWGPFGGPIKAVNTFKGKKL